jgi:phospholipase/carboxylesterase
MRELRLGDLDCVLTGGPDRDGGPVDAGPGGPLVVLLHGFGAPGTDLVGLWRVLDVPRETRFLFPAAPIRLGGPYADGRAWWPIDLAALERALARGELRDLAGSEPEGLPPARAALSRALDEAAARLAPSAVVLGGFSQGAMLACDLALTEPARPLAGLALLSGTLLAEARWSAAAPARAGLRVLQSHGTHDPLLPFVMAERLRDRLGDAGLVVDFVPFRGAHEIPMQVLDRLGAFVREVCGAAGGARR